MVGQGWNADVPGEPYGGICVYVIREEPFNKTGGHELLFPYFSSNINKLSVFMSIYKQCEITCKKIL